MQVKIKIISLIVVLVVIIVLVYSGYFLNLVYFSHSNNQTEQRFIIAKGQGVNQISQNLYQAGLIKDKFVFETYVYFKKVESKFQAGEYWLSPKLSLRDLAFTLTSGQVPQEKQITFIEGWNNKEMGEYLEKEGIVSQEEFLSRISDLKPSDFDYSFLKELPQTAGLEGFLFPDTYRVYRDASVEDIVQKALNNFSQKLTPEMQTEIKRQGKTIYEIITLASIIEQEVYDDEDRKIVADVFYKRLEQGIGLQADSTINYITGKNALQSSADDLEIDSLYNTYKYRGLPPGPICNPGLSAISAAIYPQKNDYWFFLTTPEGKTIFSKNFEEHKRNKNKYLN